MQAPALARSYRCHRHPYTERATPALSSWLMPSLSESQYATAKTLGVVVTRITVALIGKLLIGSRTECNRLLAHVVILKWLDMHFHQEKWVNIRALLLYLISINGEYGDLRDKDVGFCAPDELGLQEQARCHGWAVGQSSGFCSGCWSAPTEWWVWI